MTEEQAQKYIEASRQVSAEIGKSKKLAIQFFIDAGIIEAKPRKKISTKKKK